GVLAYDVQLFAGARVVLAADVEVTRDGVGGDEGAVGMAFVPFVVGARILRVGAARQQQVFGDLPADAVHAAPASDADERLGLRGVDDEVSPVKLRIVVGVAQLTDE